MKEIVIDVAVLDKAILIPPELYKRSDVCGGTKIIFSNAITECARNLYRDDISRYVRSATNHVKAYALDIDVPSIAGECYCSLEQAQKIKAELIKLAETLDIEKCFSELGLNTFKNMNK